MHCPQYTNDSINPHTPYFYYQYRAHGPELGGQHYLVPHLSKAFLAAGDGR